MKLYDGKYMAARIHRSHLENKGFAFSERGRLDLYSTDMRTESIGSIENVNY